VSQGGPRTAPRGAGTTLSVQSSCVGGRVLSYIEIGQVEAKMAVQGDAPTDPKLANGYFVPPRSSPTWTTMRGSLAE
jgi:hypothetical protein